MSLGGVGCEAGDSGRQAGRKSQGLASTTTTTFSSNQHTTNRSPYITTTTTTSARQIPFRGRRQEGRRRNEAAHTTSRAVQGGRRCLTCPPPLSLSLQWCATAGGGRGRLQEYDWSDVRKNRFLDGGETNYFLVEGVRIESCHPSVPWLYLWYSKILATCEYKGKTTFLKNTSNFPVPMLDFRVHI